MTRTLLAAATALALLTTAPVALGDPYTASSAFGGEVPAAGLRAPGGADTAADGTLYVADSEHHRILVFDADGDFVRSRTRSRSPRAERPARSTEAAPRERRLRRRRTRPTARRRG